MRFVVFWEKLRIDNFVLRSTDLYYIFLFLCNFRTTDGNTALYHAARLGFVPIVKDLIEAGAAATINQIKSANPAGNTPLLALRENIQKNSIGLEAAEEIEQILLENGALENPTQQFGGQRT